MVVDLAVLDATVADLLRAARDVSPGTRASYERRWRMWRAFAEHHGVAALPAEPEHVAAFVLARHRAGVSQAGIAANLSAVAWFHERAAEGASSITEAGRATLRAVSRDGTGEPRRPAPVLSVGALLAMAEALPSLGTKFAAKVVRAALPTVKPRQLAELTVDDVEVDLAGRWAVLALPGMGWRGKHPQLAAATVRLEADPGWVACPVRAVGQLVAAAVDGRLFTQRLLFQEGLDEFDPVTSSDGVPARLLVRDVAIVCVGYCGALRVEELSRALLEDIEPVGDLYRLRLPMTKTTRTMADQAVLLERRDDALDPIRALDRWLVVRGDADGPLFTNLHHRAPGRKTAGDHLPAGNIRVIVQDLAASVGLPSTVSGYSLRRSWATHRYLADPHDLASITMQLRHASMDMTVRYVEDLRPGDLNGDDILSTDQVLASAGGQPVGRKDIGFDPAPLADLVAEATVLSSPQANVAPSTARVNDSLWATWSVWAREQGFSPMPATAEALALFIAARADKGLKPGSLRAQLRQIVREHATLGYPTLGLASLAEEILDAYSRTHTGGPGKDPIRAAQLGAICLTLSQPPAHALRDLAVCLLATDATLDLGPGQLAALERSSIFHPERPLEPLVLLVTRRGGPSLHPVEVWPNALTDICPVTALQALTGTPHDGAGQNGGKAFGVTLEGVVHLVNDQVRRAGLKPVTVDRRLPRLDVEQRMVLAAAIAQPSDEDKRNRAISPASTGAASEVTSWPRPAATTSTWSTKASSGRCPGPRTTRTAKARSEACPPTPTHGSARSPPSPTGSNGSPTSTAGHCNPKTPSSPASADPAPTTRP